jgi:hypothetical protein
LGFLGRSVVEGDGEVGAEEALGDRGSHEAEADDAVAGGGLHGLDWDRGAIY